MYDVLCTYYVTYTSSLVYVDLGTGASDSATLALAFMNANTNRKWDIKVAQIPCGATYAYVFLYRYVQWLMSSFVIDPRANAYNGRPVWQVK